MGKIKYLELLQQRQKCYEKLKQSLDAVAKKFTENVSRNSSNDISLGTNYYIYVV